VELTQERLKQLLIYNPDTGVFIWKKRQGIDRETRRWNSRYYGKVAGYKRVDKGVSSTRYIVVSIADRPFLAHRLAFLYMTGNFPEDKIDHINGNSLDNRWVNLRAVTVLENNRNKRLPRNNTSGVVGVYWHKWHRKWNAMISVGGRLISLGYFTDMADAVVVRRNAEREYGYHANHGRVI